MGADTKIQWANHTFNPWRGCVKVAAGCANCYAEAMSKRNPKTLGVWGKDGTRVIASEAMWREPFRWNRQAEWWCPACNTPCFELNGTCRGCAYCCRKPTGAERPRVFCASLADVFEEWPGQLRVASGNWAAVRREWGVEKDYAGCNLQGGSDACFVKQVGAAPRPGAAPSDVAVRFIKDPKGGDPAEWPEDLRVQQLPEVAQ